MIKDFEPHPLTCHLLPLDGHLACPSAGQFWLPLSLEKLKSDDCAFEHPSQLHLPVFQKAIRHYMGYLCMIEGGSSVFSSYFWLGSFRT